MSVPLNKARASDVNEYFNLNIENVKGGDDVVRKTLFEALFKT